MFSDYEKDEGDYKTSILRIIPWRGLPAQNRTHVPPVSCCNILWPAGEGDAIFLCSQGTAKGSSFVPRVS